MEKKTPQQRQYEQVKDQLTSLLQEMGNTLDLMPTKGDSKNNCRKINILHHVNLLWHYIDRICLEDFTPNEHSKGFELSYS